MGSGYSENETAWLVEQLEEGGLELDFGIIEELERRQDCIQFLENTVKHGYSQGNGWALIHAVHLLAQIGKPECLDLLIFALVNRQTELEDYLSEDLPGLLAGFGPKALPKLERIAKLDVLDGFARGSAITAISAIGWKHGKDSREKAVSILKELVEDADSTVSTDAVMELCELQEESAVPLILRAFAEGWTELELVDKEDALELMRGKHEPMIAETFNRCAGYFTEKNFAKLREVEKSWLEEPKEPERPRGKIGRNHPCPCGSGKKYKKCHLPLEWQE